LRSAHIARFDDARAELATAVAMLREMGMAFWLPEAERGLIHFLSRSTSPHHAANSSTRPTIVAGLGRDGIADPPGRLDADDAPEARPGAVGIDEGEVVRITDGPAAPPLDPASDP